MGEPRAQGTSRPSLAVMMAVTVTAFGTTSSVRSRGSVSVNGWWSPVPIEWLTRLENIS